jgi:serine/threonine protein kinase/CHASE2 domain-containing sensor protein
VPADLKPGDIVERYRVESILGEGGTARVYRVRHTTLETVHALKVLTLDHPKIRERLIAEGKAQAKLLHPNIVPVRDVLDTGGAPALLMDFVPGPSMLAMLDEGLPAPKEVIRLFRAIVDGVGFAHSRGLIHRDLKPANVLLDHSSEPHAPKVTDFGLVRLLHLPEGAIRQTAMGTMMGTLGYMAPEQFEDAHAADERTDIFALGAVLYAMLTGRPPFEGADRLSVMTATATGRYQPISEVLGHDPEPCLNEVIVRCLQPRPEQRPQTTLEILEILDSGPSAPATKDAQVQTKPIQQPNGPQVKSTFIVQPPPSPADPQLLSTVVTALVVDHTGQGHAGQLSVVIDPDGSGVQHPPNVARDAEIAAQLAVAVALGAGADTVGVRWTLRGMKGDLGGTSLGLPLAVALHCAWNGNALGEGCAFTGGVDLDGRIAPVSGMPAKLRAASEFGCKTVYVPADGLGQMDAIAGMDIHPVRSFSSLMVRLFPPDSATKKMRLTARWLALLLPVMMAITGLTSKVEPLVHDPLLRWIHGPLMADNTAILAFEPQRDARALRALHPAVIDGLVDAGAKAIFFDVLLLAATEHDRAIADAIKRAKARGVRVILPLMNENDLVEFPESAVLRDAAWFGAVLAQADTTFWHVRRAPVRVRTLGDGDHWHAAVQTVRAHLNVTDEPRVEDGILVIGPNRNPVWSDLAYLHPTNPSPVMRYDDQNTWGMAKGRSVLIGEMGGADDVHRTAKGAVYGVEIEAALVETLLQQRAPRLASPEMNALFALLLGLYMATLTIILPVKGRWATLSAPIIGITIGAAFIVAGMLVAFIPMLLSVGIGAWVGRSRKTETK